MLETRVELYYTTRIGNFLFFKYLNRFFHRYANTIIFFKHSLNTRRSLIHIKAHHLLTSLIIKVEP